jgi:hypothetical protein
MCIIVTLRRDTGEELCRGTTALPMDDTTKALVQELNREYPELRSYLEEVK